MLVDDEQLHTGATMATTANLRLWVTDEYIKRYDNVRPDPIIIEWVQDWHDRRRAAYVTELARRRLRIE